MSNGHLCDYEAGKEAKAQVDASKGEQQARNSEMNNFDTTSISEGHRHKFWL